MSEPLYAAFSGELLHWFDQHGRKDLPWQQDINPYRVWVSEIMLQQTQVATVIPYFHRFISAFPTLKSLAEAKIDQVLHLWTGLGYYARGRNLHRTAQLVTAEHNGELPNNLDQLIELPGIGRSTAGAIMAISMGGQTSILDGNVKRVLARYFTIPGWPGKSDTLKTLWQAAEDCTPSYRVADYTQAIMDLGATVCSRSKPDCPICPLEENCQANKLDSQTDFPGKKPKKVLPVRQSHFAILQNPLGEVLLEQKPPSGLWGGLWVFPDLPGEQQDTQNTDDLLTSISQRFPWTIKSSQTLPTKRHTFSHFHLDYTPVVIQIENPSSVMDTQSLVWYNPASPLQIGTPTPIQQLLRTLKPANSTEN